MQDEVKVSQADIEAVRHFYNNSSANLTGQELVELEQAFARHRHQAERDTLARMEWRDIESAPKDRYFLACVTPERSEEKLLKAIFGDDYQIPDNRGIIVARWRPKQRKGRVFMSVTGASFWATHWMELPDVPSFKEKGFPRDY